MQQRLASLPALLTSRGDTTRKLVAPLHPTLPLENGNNIHRGTRLPLNVLSVGNNVLQTILKKVLKDSTSQIVNPEFHNVLHVVAQHHLVPLGSSLVSLLRPLYPPPSPPPPPPKPPPPPQPRLVWVCASWTVMFDRQVTRGDSDYLKRLLSNDMDPNFKDYNYRSPLRIAAAEGLYFMAKLLLEGGTSVFTKDRWGNTTLEEARMCGNKNLIKLLEDAKSAQQSEFPSQEYTDQNASKEVHNDRKRN
ncbi:hypothetical protein JHK82_031133 [Glycine max]|nr:hypothetical protein JHK82_031133 [Glycine max]